MGTVLLFERYPVHPDRRDEFVAAVLDHLHVMRTRPGLLWADSAEASDDTPSWIVLSEWRTAPDTDAWTTSAQADTFRDATAPWLRADPTIRRFAGRSG